jgi:hypothetical protein
MIGLHRADSIRDSRPQPSIEIAIRGVDALGCLLLPIIAGVIPSLFVRGAEFESPPRMLH